MTTRFAEIASTATIKNGSKLIGHAAPMKIWQALRLAAGSTCSTGAGRGGF